MSDVEFRRWREASIKQVRFVASLVFPLRQRALQGIPLPTLNDREKKIKAIDECKQYVLSNADISKMVEEKSRFRQAPINYAMAKNELLKEIVTAHA